MKATIVCKYTAYTNDTVSIPGIRSFERVKDWYVKEGRFHYTLDRETWLEIKLNAHDEPDIDMKRPLEVEVYPGAANSRGSRLVSRDGEGG